MLCITNAYGVMNVKQAQFASKHVDDGLPSWSFLLAFIAHLYGFPK